MMLRHWTGYARFLFCVGLGPVLTRAFSPQIDKIINDAIAGEHSYKNVEHIYQWFWADGINLTALPFAPAAFASIEAILIPVTTNISLTSNSTRVDTHGELHQRV